MDFRIEWTGLAEFEAGLRQAPRIVEDELTVAATNIVRVGESLSRQYAPRWHDEAYDSIYGHVVPGGMNVAAVWGASSEHAWYADHGRGPGKMPPAGALVGWHGITEKEEFVVRRAIGRRGTKGKPFVSRSFKEISQGFALTELRKALARALARIGGH